MNPRSQLSPRRNEAVDDVDVVVIGAGFGGLGAAVQAARSGARVALFESLNYPGGCASTFTKDGVQYETGATLFSGLGKGQLFDVWRRELGLDVRFDMLDSPIEFRTPSMTLDVPSRRETLIEHFCAMPEAPVEAIRAFFSEQKHVADILWPIFDDPERLPPFSSSAVRWHAGRLGSYFGLLRYVMRPVARVLERHGLSRFEPLVSFVNAMSQITVQAGVEEAEAPFALSTMDYCFRGTGHIHGGIGKLAWQLVHALERLGGQVHMSHRVRGIQREGDTWCVQARRKVVRSPVVIANLLPGALGQLLGSPDHGLDRDMARLKQGWGAAMLYLTVDPQAISTTAPHHLQLVGDTTEPFLEGNHVFCSVSGTDEIERAPDGLRTVTVSTHIPAARLSGGDHPDVATYIDRVHHKMRETIEARAPELLERVTHQMTASPRTWERFTRRPGGLVGGMARTAGWHNYQGLFPRPISKGLYMVGDSVFPGQSTLATAVGGVRTARAALSNQHVWLSGPVAPGAVPATETS